MKNTDNICTNETDWVNGRHSATSNNAEYE